MANRWYRAYEGTVSDPKLAEVAIIASTSRSVVIAAWHAILENAAGVNEGGRFDIPARRVAAALCEPLATIQALFDGLAEIGMITVDAFQIVDWPSFKGLEHNRPPANVWARLRTFIFERDDWTCQYCGARGCKLECDHIFPVSRGGSSDPQNLTTACFVCNRSKRAKTIEEWRK